MAYYAQDGTLLGSVNIKKNETVPETTEAVTEATTERETHDMSKDPDDISRIYVVTDDANPTITKDVYKRQHQQKLLQLILVQRLN